MLLGGIAVIAQNYSYWRKYHDRETFLWFLGGIFGVFVVLYFFATRYLIPITPGNVLFLTWSRHILITLTVLVLILLGFRTYILKK